MTAKLRLQTSKNKGYAIEIQPKNKPVSIAELRAVLNILSALGIKRVYEIQWRD